MTRDGVPDDDMPDSFHLPPEGSQPHDDRALDSLLSGDTSDVPPSLRPVADTLNALRAAPSARELQGEAAARAQFRALQAEALADAAGPRTLDKTAFSAQLRRSASVRAARRRPVPVRLTGLVSALAVIVLAAAIAYTGHLPSGLQRIAHNTIAAPPPSSSPGSGPGRNGMQAKSASPVTPSAARPPASANAPGSSSPSSGAQGKAGLCDQYWSDLKHARPGPTSWQTPRYRQLVSAAGGARNVFAYCYPVWDPKYAPQYQQLPSHPPYFPRQWGPGGAQGNGQDQNQGPGQPGQGQGQNPGGQQGTGQNQDQQPAPSPSAPSGSPTGKTSRPPAGNQGQNSDSQQN